MTVALKSRRTAPTEPKMVIFWPLFLCLLATSQASVTWAGISGHFYCMRLGSGHWELQQGIAGGTVEMRSGENEMQIATVRTAHNGSFKLQGDLEKSGEGYFYYTLRFPMSVDQYYARCLDGQTTHGYKYSRYSTSKEGQYVKFLDKDVRGKYANGVCQAQIEWKLTPNVYNEGVSRRVVNLDGQNVGDVVEDCRKQMMNENPEVARIIHDQFARIKKAQYNEKKRNDEKNSAKQNMLMANAAFIRIAGRYVDHIGFNVFCMPNELMEKCGSRNDTPPERENITLVAHSYVLQSNKSKSVESCGGRVQFTIPQDHFYRNQQEILAYTEKVFDLGELDIGHIVSGCAQMRNRALYAQECVMPALTQHHMNHPDESENLAETPWTNPARNKARITGRFVCNHKDKDDVVPVGGLNVSFNLQNNGRHIASASSSDNDGNFELTVNWGIDLDVDFTCFNKSFVQQTCRGAKWQIQYYQHKTEVVYAPETFNKSHTCAINFCRARLSLEQGIPIGFYERDLTHYLIDLEDIHIGALLHKCVNSVKPQGCDSYC